MTTKPSDTMNANDKNNATIIKKCEKAASDLQRAWGKGDQRGRKQVEKWDEWFRELAFLIVDTKNAGRLSPEAEKAALDACKAVLGLGKKVPHWEHTDDIALIRSTLRMNEEFNDYPVKESVGFEESDDDEY